MSVDQLRQLANTLSTFLESRENSFSLNPYDNSFAKHNKTEKAQKHHKKYRIGYKESGKLADRVQEQKYKINCKANDEKLLEVGLFTNVIKEKK